MDSILHVGRIPFLVCAPFFHRMLGLDQPGWDYTDAPPRVLNALLRAGNIHLAPSSSLEYAQSPAQYVIAPDICTSSTLEIRSVKLFSRLPWERLHGQPVHLTGQSDTSVALVRVLSAQYFQVEPVYVEQGVFDPTGQVARVLIGDQALSEDAQGAWPYAYDLASVWQQWQGLPFVFGMWIVHRLALEPAVRPVLDRFLDEVAASVDAFRQDRALALKHWCAVYPADLSWELVLSYYDAVDYRFTPDRKESLRLFYACCARLGLIPSVPELHFL